LWCACMVAPIRSSDSMRPSVRRAAGSWLERP
jgi:hypothetical protein